MMNRAKRNHFLWNVLLAGLGLAAVAAVPTQAAEDKPVEDEVGQALSSLQLADELINYGRSTQTPEALITAALILHRNPTEAITVEGADKPDTDSTPKALLEEARGMRKDDKALAGVIDRALDTIKEAPRGFVAALAAHRGKLNSGKPLVIKHELYKKKTAKGAKHSKAKIKVTRLTAKNEDAAAKKKKHRHRLHVIVKHPKGHVVAEQKSAPGADSIDVEVPAPAEPGAVSPGLYQIEVHAEPVDAPAAAAEAKDPSPPQDVSINIGEDLPAAAAKP